jgi:RNA ligase
VELPLATSTFIYENGVKKMESIFPVIKHINDVLPAIEGRSEFFVADKGSYTVINYHVNFDDTFPPLKVAGGSPKMRAERMLHNKLLRECRGIIFDAEGKLISRRLHKFFNVGEREETKFEKLPWDKPYTIMDKLDGSMITPLYLGDLRWGTKMGPTEVSDQVEEFVKHDARYVCFADIINDLGATPIFEWCSNKQRIVVDHKEDELILTHIRWNETGEYWSRHMVAFAAKDFHIPVVNTWHSEDWPPETLLDVVKRLEGEEGVVVQFHDGSMVKIKSDWYVRIHRAKDMIRTERHTLACILNNEIDDLLPILEEDDVKRIRDLETEFKEGIEHAGWLAYVNLKTAQSSGMDRKTFALEVAPKLNDMVKSIVFKFFDKKDAGFPECERMMLDFGKKALHSEKDYDIFKRRIEEITRKVTVE